jgi:hypothetical protein
VIRQAISCDICASEKKQTNHWFVAYEQGGELRVGGWNSRNRLRPGSKHLCGQTCLHKLMDELMAKSIAQRPLSSAASEVHEHEEDRPARTDTSLTSEAAHVEFESSARLVTPVANPIPVASAPVAALPPVAAIRPQTDVLAMPAKIHVEARKEATNSGDEARFASASWRAEAWEREREREMRAVERRPDIARRRSTA